MQFKQRVSDLQFAFLQVRRLEALMRDAGGRKAGRSGTAGGTEAATDPRQVSHRSYACSPRGLEGSKCALSWSRADCHHTALLRRA